MLIRSRLFQVAGLMLVLLTVTSINLGQRKCCATDKHSPQTACPFDRSTLSFAGTPLDQSKRLLRRVEQQVIIDSALSLEEAIGSQDVPADIRANLALVNVKYYSFDGKQHQGQLLVDKALKADIAAIFAELAQSKFPIAKVIPVSKYGFSDRSSMEDNNTSAFNYRVIAGTTKLSNHARGRAIDINPFLNPYIRKGTIDPPEAKYDANVPGTIVANGVVVKAFKKRGWSWGGEWTSLKDYQHFEK